MQHQNAHVAAGLHEAVRFIPVSRSNVMARLLAPEHWVGHDQKAVDTAIHYLGRLRQQDSAIKLDELMDDYHLFNPDDDMAFAAKLPDEEKEKQRRKFLDGVGRLVFRANFETITREVLELAITETSPFGVDVTVDLDEFEPLLTFYRGKKILKRSKRDWRFAYVCSVHHQVQSYERMFLALTLKPTGQRIAEIMKKDDLSHKQAERRFNKMRRAMPDWVSSDHVYLKLFKDIPEVDIDMLLPSCGVKFKLFDRLMLWVSGGGSAIYAIAISILKLLAVAISPILLFMTLFGFGGTLFRQVMSVINTRTRYMMELVQKLYFHNISNNEGALTLLIDEAEEEDIKEDSLLYAFLLKQHAPDLSLDKAKSEIEAFLQAEFSVKVNFDHQEAFGRLTERKLAGTGVDGVIWVMPAAKAVCRLRRLWLKSLDLQAGSATILDAPVSAGT